MELPRIMAPWASQLEIFDDDVARTLGHWLPRIDAIVGPMRSRHIDDGEPDGFDGLTRRGRYERLLMSEWLLADIAPDEFVRRAANGEHTFLRIGERSPASSTRCIALFDAGWQQIGAPHLAHLALLVALARRAFAADVPFCWGIVQAPGELRDGLSKAGVRALLQARTVVSTSADQLDAWWQTIAPTDNDEFWLVGGDELRALAQSRGVGTILVHESLAPEPRELHVHACSRGQSKSRAVLELPSSAASVRVFRHPFGAPAQQFTDLASAGLAPETPLLLIAKPRRVIGFAANGGLVAAHIPTSRWDKPGRRRRFALAVDKPIAAVGYLKKHVVVATICDGQVAICRRRGSAFGSGVLYSTAAEVPDPVPPPPGSKLRHLRIAKDIGRNNTPGYAFIDGAENLFIVRPGGGEIEHCLGGALAMQATGIGNVLVRTDSAELDVVDMVAATPPENQSNTPRFSSDNWTGDVRFGEPGSLGRSFMVALDYGSHWLVATDQGEVAAIDAMGACVLGVMTRPDHGVGLVAVDNEGLAISYIGRHERHDLVRLEEPVEGAVMAGTLVSWLDTAGVLRAWCVSQGWLLPRPSEIVT